MQGVTTTPQDVTADSFMERPAGGGDVHTLPLDAALELFRREAAVRGLPSARIRSVVSYVRSSVALPDAPAGSPGPSDLLPWLHDVRHWAEQAGRGRGERGSALRSRLSNAALFARVVTEALGLRPDGLRVAGVPPAWHPVLRRLRDPADRQALRGLVLIAAEHDVHRPDALPALAELQGWGRGDPERQEAITRGLAAYQRGRRGGRQGAAGPPRPPARAAEYGLQAVPFLAALLSASAARGGAPTGDAPLGHAGTLRARDLLRQLAPHLDHALVVFEERRLAAHGSTDYLQSAERALSRCVASVARLRVRDGVTMEGLAEELRALTLGHFWTRRRQVADADGGEGDRLGVQPEDPDLDGLVPDGDAQSGTLLRAVADELAAHSYKASPLVVSAQAERLPVPLYTPSVVQVVRRIYAIARDALRPKLLAAGEAGQHRWRTIEFEQRALVSHMTAVARRRRATGQVDKRLLPLHWGEVVCRGLPALRAEALAAEGAWEDWQGAGHAGGSERGGRLERRWHRALTAYLVTAVFTAEGLREKNLRGARLGMQVRPAWRRDLRGRVVGIERVVTHFRGDDPTWVRLKQTHDSGGGSSPRMRVREWQWPPGIVDHRLLFRYVTEVRPALARRAGLLGEEAAYDPEADRWALFLSPRPRPRRDGAQAGGGYSRAVLSDLVGRSLFWMARDLLGRPGLPATYRESCRRGHPLRGLFGAHVIRSLGATWWGGVRNRWDYAEAYTNDLQPTLHAHYAKIPTWMARAVGTGGTDDPTWWSAVVDVVVTEMDSHLDWDGFWRGFDPERRWDAAAVRGVLRAGAEGGSAPGAAGGVGDAPLPLEGGRLPGAPGRRAGAPSRRAV